MRICACQLSPASHRRGRASNRQVGVRVRGASVFVRPGDAGARTGGMRDDDLRLSVGPSRTSAVACADHRPGGSTCPWAPAGHRITAGSWHRGAKQAEKQCARIGGGETSPGPFFTLPASRRGRRPAADPRHPAGPTPPPTRPPSRRGPPPVEPAIGYTTAGDTTARAAWRLVASSRRGPVLTASLVGKTRWVSPPRGPSTLPTTAGGSAFSPQAGRRCPKGG
jgi:hypothetical protein